jgi:hypothetical protein
MDVYINEVSSTLRTADSEALLNPQVLRRLIDAVLVAAKDRQEHEHRVSEERKLRPSMTGREGANWE